MSRSGCRGAWQDAVPGAQTPHIAGYPADSHRSTGVHPRDARARSFAAALADRQQNACADRDGRRWERICAIWPAAMEFTSTAISFAKPNFVTRICSALARMPSGGAPLPPPSPRPRHLTDGPESTALLPSRREGTRTMDGRTFLIGAREGCDLWIENPMVDPCHAVIYRSGISFHLRDLEFALRLIRRQPAHPGGGTAPRR